MTNIGADASLASATELLNRVRRELLSYGEDICNSQVVLLEDIERWIEREAMHAVILASRERMESKR